MVIAKESSEDKAITPPRPIKDIPRRPGVYLFKASGERVIYVGKAKDLRSRIGSYFRASADLDPRKQTMVRTVRDMSFIVTDTELEALALEANLIKQYRPKYNVILRDDKNYPYLRIDPKEAWPKLDVVRRIKRDGAVYFGPYVPASAMYEAIRFIRRTFGIRPCRYRLDHPMRPCIQHQMGRCPAPCAGLIEREQYMRSAQDTILFLRGKKTELMDELEARMKALSSELRYEEAAEVRDSIRALRAAFESQKVVAPELGNVDVLGMVRDGADAACSVFFVRDGIMIGAKSFYLKAMGTMAAGELLHGFMESLYGSSGLVPADNIYVPEEPDGIEAFDLWLEGLRGGRVRIIVPRRGKKHELLEMAEANALLELSRRRAEGTDGILKEMAKKIGLADPPRSIGAFDISNLAGSEPVGAFVFWEDGKFKHDSYRHMKIKTVEGIDDYAMMRETVGRVLSSAEIETPDVVIIDGGAGHLMAGMEAVDALGLEHSPHVISLAKNPDRVFLPCGGESVDITDHSASSLLLRRIRDEVHRFAVSYHKKLRAKRLLSSPLEGIRGIGPKRRLQLLKHFGGYEAMREAGVDMLAALPGMNRAAAEAVKEALGD